MKWTCWLLPIAMIAAPMARAALSPLTMPPDCEALLSSHGEHFLILSKDLPELTPTLARALSQGQPVVMFIQPREFINGVQFTKPEVVALKKKIKKLGGFFYPVTSNYETYWSLQINPNLETLVALPELLKAFDYNQIAIQIHFPQPMVAPKVPKAPTTAKKSTGDSKSQSAKAGRRFVPITMDEFKGKIPEDVYDFRELSQTLAKDLAKVDFEGENQVFDGQDLPDLNTLIGYQMLPNGLTYLGVIAGGDSDLPIFFAVYWDGKTLRAYIPKDGNLWNPHTKAPFGSDPIEDVEYLKKLDPRFKDMSDSDILTSLTLDEAKLKADLTTRVQPAGN